MCSSALQGQVACQMSSTQNLSHQSLPEQCTTILQHQAHGAKEGAPTLPKHKHLWLTEGSSLCTTYTPLTATPTNFACAIALKVLLSFLLQSPLKGCNKGVEQHFWLHCGLCSTCVLRDLVWMVGWSPWLLFRIPGAAQVDSDVSKLLEEQYEKGACQCSL